MGRFDNGYFVFAHDQHLRHITNGATTEFLAYSLVDHPCWIEFDQFQPISAATMGPILLRAADYPERDCLALPHFVTKIHRQARFSPPVPERFLGPWDAAPGTGSEDGSDAELDSEDEEMDE
jgi:hypothetical protein